MSYFVDYTIPRVYDTDGNIVEHDNHDFVAFLEAGGVVTDISKPAQITKASKNSVLKVLDSHGYYDAVMALINAAPRAYQIDFQTALSVERGHPLVLATIAQGVFSESEADSMFVEAAAMDGG